VHLCLYELAQGSTFVHACTAGASSLSDRLSDILYSLQLSSLYFPTHATPMYEVEVEHGGAQ
jgi:hypothetical protein